MGPLGGVKVLEFAGIGPGPMCAMLLAEMGATVLRIERKIPSGLGLQRPRRYDLLLRSRGSVAIDLKTKPGVDLVLDLISQADACLEGFRPGVMERLGLGPDACLARNPKLVYGRITGWGQTGPLAHSAAHDLNYIALTGVVNAQGRPGEAPFVPLNLIGDYGGGALYLAMGMLAAIIHARSSAGVGQVVDAAMVDGIASLQTVYFGGVAAGIWNTQRGTNPADGGSHFCALYECADGKWISVGPVEPKFYALLLQKLEIDPARIGAQFDPANWARGKSIFAARFKTKTRAEWSSLLEGTDVCFAPVLSWSEAQAHPHLRARETFVEVDGVIQPAPAPRFSATPGPKPTPPQELCVDVANAALAAWLDRKRIDRLRADGTIL